MAKGNLVLSDPYFYFHQECQMEGIINDIDANTAGNGIICSINNEISVLDVTTNTTILLLLSDFEIMAFKVREVANNVIVATLELAVNALGNAVRRAFITKLGNIVQNNQFIYSHYLS